MKLVAFLPCDKMWSDEETGLLNFQNAGTQRIWREAYPASFETVCAAIFRKDLMDDPMKDVTFRFIDGDSVDVRPPRTVQVEFKPESDTGNIGVKFKLSIPRPGPYRFDLLFDGLRLEAWLFDFREGTPPLPSSS